MSRLQEINLQDILAGANSQSIARAKELLGPRANQNRFLDKLLRDFRVSPITDAETWKRDDIDNLLDLYSLLEIASICRFIPNPLPDTVRAVALNHLSLPSVERFYTVFHPQLLPQAFRRRVQGNAELFERECEGSEADFLFFLDISRNLAADEDVEWLLTFLDAYIIDGDSWADVKRIVQNPRRFVQTIVSAEDSAVASAVVGFWKFTAFCSSFHDFLEGLEARPLVQSAVWHYHAYWFTRLKSKLTGTLESSLDKFQILVSLSPHGQMHERSNDPATQIAERRRAFQDLFSTKYETPLQRALARQQSRGTPMA
jgi:hypothetical protein